MKRNGFTFVELIVIIGLLAILAIIIGTNMVGLQGEQQDKNYESFKKKLEYSSVVLRPNISFIAIASLAS